ncbi:MAG: zinc-ribbon domain-containing protein [Deltaproteobacteria bacterium]|nr:zinc-ribbon domain-containing protein [Deltaproteobacteria bacterium]
MPRPVPTASPPRTSLAKAYPKLARQWHPTRNGGCTPADVLPGSHRKVWWKCPAAPDHEWQTPVYSRTGQGTGCPFCTGRWASRAHNLARHRPHLAAEWHPTKNGDLTPVEVVPGSNRKVWWRCRAAGHEWTARIHDRGVLGHGCPYCRGHRASAKHSLAARFPDIAVQWHPVKNGELTPADVTPHSAYRAWWRCPKGPDHEWQDQVNARTGGKKGCPFCAGMRVSVTNRLAVLHPKLAREWHPTKNGKKTPWDFVALSVKRAWWICKKGPDHVWRAGIASRVYGTGCPCCSNHKVSVTNSLATRFPKVAAQWHPTRNGRLRPGDVVAGANRRAWWACPAGPDHEWATTVSNRTFLGNGCPFCSGRRASVTNSLATLHPELAAQWDRKRNGKLRPSDVVPGSLRPAWWRCPKGPDHVWETPVYDRVRTPSCPFCRGRRSSVTNSLASLFPEVAAEWHPTRNGGVEPSEVVALAREYAWWRCARGHAWREQIRTRTAKGRGCPVCAEDASVR